MHKHKNINFQSDVHPSARASEHLSAGQVCHSRSVTRSFPASQRIIDSAVQQIMSVGELGIPGCSVILMLLKPNGHFRLRTNCSLTQL